VLKNHFLKEGRGERETGAPAPPPPQAHPQRPGPPYSPQWLQAGHLRDPLHAGRVCPHALERGGLEPPTCQGAQAALGLRGTRLLELTGPVRREGVGDSTT
jgi:hypothetical protein